ncbi:MAG TPA: imelysin family protein [Kiritimatiellia bacterium]|nr:imelysin family protein [Kiritimatiellia bacterium]HMO98931.1 imelysin family protein [Kiritimatiellia bacterium]
MKTWIMLLVVAFTQTALARDGGFSEEALNEVTATSRDFLEAVTEFTTEPSDASYARAISSWKELYTAWKSLAPDYADQTLQRDWTRWFASTRIAEDDLESLITASRCPVPFSKEMIGMLSADMQGIHTSYYLLTRHPQGVNDPVSMIALYRDQPRRCAYLRSITEMLVEKTGTLRAGS